MKEEILRALQRAVDYLRKIFEKLGDPANRKEAWEILERYKKYPDIDSFYKVVDLRGPRIKWHANVKPLLGYDDLDLNKYFNIIHVDFVRLYVEFGCAAYQIGLEMSEELTKHNTYYAIMVPLRKANGEYWWFKQISIPLEFDANNRMVSHLNIYRIIDRYHRLSPSRPLVVFDAINQESIENRLAKYTHKDFLQKALFSELTPAHLKVLKKYCELHMKIDPHKSYQERRKLYPKAEEVAKELGSTKYAVQTRNKEILEMARDAFPASDYKTINDLANFVNQLFGGLGS